MSAASDRAAPCSARQTGLLIAALASLLLLFHCYARPLLPERQVVIDPGLIQPLGEGSSTGYLYPFDAAPPDRPQNPNSRVRLLQDGQLLEVRTAIGPRMHPIRNGTWAHVEGAILFSARDNRDPRTGQPVFTLCYPAFTGPFWGWLATATFALSVILLWRERPPRPTPAPPAPADANPLPRLHLLAMSAVLLAGIYCNTGTLTPYANTGIPLIDRETGYLYNIDHEEFRALFAFVDGAARSTWEHALLLRRILYPVLAWPFMKAAGFELGGVIANALLGLAGLLASVHFLRRQVGPQGALCAGWLLALYPGTTYWTGLPYLYAVIVPGSLLLMAGLVRLSQNPPPRQLALVSLGLGLGYLAYDFALFFLPASLLILVADRRWRDASVSAVLQAAPLALWLLALRFVFNIPAANSNTASYGQVLHAYLAPGEPAAWLSSLADLPVAAWQVWFGSNFLFLPLLALAALALSPVTSRVAPGRAELALLVAALALFIVLNLAPPQNTMWNMRGAWISRLYQPVLAACLYWIARWWQHLPRTSPTARRTGIGLLLAVLAANAVIIFGPLLANLVRLPGDAYFRFYTHTDVISVRSFELNLTTQGRRPLGFPARPAP